MNPRRLLALAGLWGALLTVVILAMSVLMRLGTRIEAGTAVSVLAPDVEAIARVVHRLAAMAVGALAAGALVAAWQARPLSRGLGAAVAGIAGLTLLLSVIGRYTPGYRFDVVTVANVVGGIGLAVAFWWARAASAGTGRGDAVATIALALLLVLAALGAGADAAAMRGESAFGLLHLWVAAFFTAFALAAAWRQRRRPAAIAVAALCAIQLGTGWALADARPLALAGIHALVACALALGLAQLGARRQES